MTVGTVLFAPALRCIMFSPADLVGKSSSSSFEIRILFDMVNLGQRNNTHSAQFHRPYVMHLIRHAVHTSTLILKQFYSQSVLISVTKQHYEAYKLINCIF